MTLRPYIKSDAPIILSWIADRAAFRKWCADRLPVYPPRPEDMDVQYATDCIFPFTALDDNGEVVGHLMLRYPDASKTLVRLGFVIVSDELRGKGYGKQMLQLAIEKAKKEFGAEKITLGVFDNNPSALHCYESAGFKVAGAEKYVIDGEEWNSLEMEIK
ncbi:MAG: GNAT family N-acetyltransferase [Bacteroidales bacterium]|nr:GNAT family N-acetyltransferase [Bacteroidales bacterium]